MWYESWKYRLCNKHAQGHPCDEGRGLERGAGQDPPELTGGSEDTPIVEEEGGRCLLEENRSQGRLDRCEHGV